MNGLDGDPAAPEVKGWFDTFNGAIYFNRADAQRAVAGGNTVLPVYHLPPGYGECRGCRCRSSDG